MFSVAIQFMKKWFLHRPLITETVQLLYYMWGLCIGVFFMAFCCFGFLVFFFGFFGVFFFVFGFFACLLVGFFGLFVFAIKSSESNFFSYFLKKLTCFSVKEFREAGKFSLALSASFK